MDRKWKWMIAVMLLSLAVVNPLPAENNSYDVGGQIQYSEAGKIYVYLVDEEIFGTPYTGLQTIVLESMEMGKGRGSASFKFQNVKSGVYGIRCYQDINGNGKLDRGLFGPSEPWGMSWNSDRPSKWPSYTDITFKVDSGLQPITIKLK